MGGSERIVDKFVKKFPNDKTAEQLFETYASGDYETAFRMAHTLKGLCLNLGFDKLRNSASELTESLRNGVSENSGDLLETVRRDYTGILELLKELD